MVDTPAIYARAQQDDGGAATTQPSTQGECDGEHSGLENIITALSATNIDNEKSPLLRLPKEIRDQIWELSLTGRPRQKEWDQFDSKYTSVPWLAGTCRSIHEEIMAIFYGDMVLCFHFRYQHKRWQRVFNPHYGEFMTWLVRIGEQNRRLLKSVFYELSICESPSNDRSFWQTDTIEMAEGNLQGWLEVGKVTAELAAGEAFPEEHDTTEGVADSVRRRIVKPAVITLRPKAREFVKEWEKKYRDYGGRKAALLHFTFN